MSATNRGATRKKNDLYETPDWLTNAILPILAHPLSINSENDVWKILEPGAGMGAITRCVKERWPMISDVTQIELDEETAKQNPYPTTVANFLEYDFKGQYFDLVIGNPPFSLVQEFITKSLTLAPIVAMLLRVNFLGGQKRSAWTRKHLYNTRIYVTPKRPPFSTNKKGKPGTDATEYAWFVYGMGNGIHLLETEDDKYKSHR